MFRRPRGCRGGPATEVVVPGGRHDAGDDLAATSDLDRLPRGDGVEITARTLAQFVEVDSPTGVDGNAGRARVAGRHDPGQEPAVTDDVDRLAGRNPVEAAPGPRPEFVEPDPPALLGQLDGAGGDRRDPPIADGQDLCHQLAAADDIERLPGGNPLQVPAGIAPKLAQANHFPHLAPICVHGLAAG